MSKLKQSFSDHLCNGIIILLCGILIGMFLGNKGFIFQHKASLEEEQIDKEYSYVNKVLKVHDKTGKNLWIDDPLPLTAEEKEIEIEIERDHKLANLYSELNFMCEAPSLNIIKATMHMDFGAYYHDDMRFNFAWEERRWIKYQLYDEYSHEKINQWCQEYGENMQCFLFWGTESHLIEDILFHRDTIRFRFEFDSLNDFEIIVTNNETKKTLIFNKQNLCGTGEFHIKNENNLYSIQIHTDGYWVLLCD